MTNDPVVDHHSCHSFIAKSASEVSFYYLPNGAAPKQCVTNINFADLSTATVTCDQDPAVPILMDVEKGQMKMAMSRDPAFRPVDFTPGDNVVIIDYVRCARFEHQLLLPGVSDKLTFESTLEDDEIADAQIVMVHTKVTSADETVRPSREYVEKYNVFTGEVERFNVSHEFVKKDKFYLSPDGALVTYDPFTGETEERYQSIGPVTGSFTYGIPSLDPTLRAVKDHPLGCFERKKEEEGASITYVINDGEFIHKCVDTPTAEETYKNRFTQVCTKYTLNDEQVGEPRTRRFVLKSIGHGRYAQYFFAEGHESDTAWPNVLAHPSSFHVRRHILTPCQVPHVFEGLWRETTGVPVCFNLRRHGDTLFNERNGKRYVFSNLTVSNTVNSGIITETDTQSDEVRALRFTFEHAPSSEVSNVGLKLRVNRCPIGSTTCDSGIPTPEMPDVRDIVYSRCDRDFTDGYLGQFVDETNGFHIFHSMILTSDKVFGRYRTNLDGKRVYDVFEQFGHKFSTSNTEAGDVDAVVHQHHVDIYGIYVFTSHGMLDSRQAELAGKEYQYLESRSMHDPIYGDDWMHNDRGLCVRHREQGRFSLGYGQTDPFKPSNTHRCVLNVLLRYRRGIATCIFGEKNKVRVYRPFTYYIIRPSRHVVVHYGKAYTPAWAPDMATTTSISNASSAATNTAADGSVAVHASIVNDDDDVPYDWPDFATWTPCFTSVDTSLNSDLFRGYFRMTELSGLYDPLYISQDWGIMPVRTDDPPAPCLQWTSSIVDEKTTDAIAFRTNEKAGCYFLIHKEARVEFPYPATGGCDNNNYNMDVHISAEGLLIFRQYEEERYVRAQYATTQLQQGSPAKTVVFKRCSPPANRISRFQGSRPVLMWSPGAAGSFDSRVTVLSTNKVRVNIISGDAREGAYIDLTFDNLGGVVANNAIMQSEPQEMQGVYTFNANNGVNIGLGNTAAGEGPAVSALGHSAFMKMHIGSELRPSGENAPIGAFGKKGTKYAQCTMFKAIDLPQSTLTSARSYKTAAGDEVKEYFLKQDPESPSYVSGNGIRVYNGGKSRTTFTYAAVTSYGGMLMVARSQKELKDGQEIDVYDGSFPVIAEGAVADVTNIVEDALYPCIGRVHVRVAVKIKPTQLADGSIANANAKFDDVYYAHFITDVAAALGINDRFITDRRLTLSVTEPEAGYLNFTVTNGWNDITPEFTAKVEKLSSTNELTVQVESVDVDDSMSPPPPPGPSPKPDDDDGKGSKTVIIIVIVVGIAVVAFAIVAWRLRWYTKLPCCRRTITAASLNDDDGAYAAFDGQAYSSTQYKAPRYQQV